MRTPRHVILVALITALPVRPTHGQDSSPAPEPEAPLVHGFFDLNYKYMTGNWGGVRDTLESNGIKFSLTYQQQGFVNAHGGLDTADGSRFAGSYDLKLTVDTGKLGLWEGGYGYIKAKGNWRESNGLNRGKFGGLSKPNGDEGSDDAIYVSKWWIGQKFLDGLLDLRVGRLESKKDLFDKNAYADSEDKYFMNDWFRRSPNVPHTTSIGARLKVQPTDWFYAQMGVFDGDSTGSKTAGTQTAFHDSAHYIAFWELVFSPKLESARGALPGNYRFGLWYDGRPKEIFLNDLGGIRRPRYDNDDVGFYISFDQLVLKENDEPKDKQGLGLFLRYAYAHEEVNRIEHFWSVGGQYQGLVPNRDKDVLGFGVAQGILSGDYHDQIDDMANRETVYELYYRIKLTPWMAFTPDLQYIDEPGGRGRFEDGFIAGFRLRITF